MKHLPCVSPEEAWVEKDLSSLAGFRPLWRCWLVPASETMPEVCRREGPVEGDSECVLFLDAPQFLAPPIQSSLGLCRLWGSLIQCHHLGSCPKVLSWPPPSFRPDLCIAVWALICPLWIGKSREGPSCPRPQKTTGPLGHPGDSGGERGILVNYKLNMAPCWG